MSNAAHAQFKRKTAAGDESWKNNYRAASEKINDLVNTKLDVKFDFSKSYMYGKAWVTLKPHFYATDSLTLDAKGMDIKKIALWNNAAGKDLVYKYDNMQLFIKLDHTYKAGEPYTVYIEYTAKPDELKAEGSAAIRDAKGLYFINPKGEEKDKPTEIWTQGETEASSVWFPTIDKPNQKTTEEITMTVPDKYVTLSNGKLVSQKKNADGTRTDSWKMELPHSPYLFFMGVGEFAIVKDSYKGKEVSYYVEKNYESVARKIFGLTPEMIQFYATRLGVEYPWDKYSQIVGRDYVSGAMENTTSTLHSEYLQQNARQLVDGNKYEDYISHELFHQWFGDLVTAESWSNLTLNESFANYSETLWDEYKHGKDAAEKRNYEQMNEYIQSGSEEKQLVRFYYRDKEDMFDRVSYEKGGRILNMLRNFVGDDAFFKSLNLYLNTYKFKNAEAQQLRLAFEEVTGKDLNWFWNQWYYGAGHPRLNITYGYDDKADKASVIVEQKQDGQTFKLPVAIDVYNGTSKTRYNVWVQNKADTFYFASAKKPDLINFDGDKMLLCEKQENKTLEDYVYQYHNAKKYVDRREAVDFAVQHKTEAAAAKFLIEALSDPFAELRRQVLENISSLSLDNNTMKTIETIASKDVSRKNRAAAINVLGIMLNAKYTDMFVAGAKDSSYSVAGASLSGLADLNAAKALELLPELKKDMKGDLETAVGEVEVLQKGDADFEEVTKDYDKQNIYIKANHFTSYLKYLGNVNNPENFKKGVDKIVALRDLIAGYSPEYKAYVNDELQKLKRKKERMKTSENAAQIDEEIKYLDKKSL